MRPAETLKVLRRRIPGVVEMLFWIGLFVIGLELLGHWFDRASTHPVLFASIAGVASATLFLTPLFWDWRFGDGAISQAKDRVLQAGQEPDAPLTGAMVIVGLCVLVCIGILWAAFAYRPVSGEAITDTHRAWIGAIAAAIAAPFLFYPIILAIGVLTRPRQVTARCRFILEKPVERPLNSRAKVERMPSGRGLKQPVAAGDGAWICLPKGLDTWALRLDWQVTIPTQTDDALEIVVETRGGDRETIRLTRSAESVLDATITGDIRTIWSRGIVAIAGRSSYARLMATMEAARLTAMLGVEVEIADLQAA